MGVGQILLRIWSAFSDVAIPYLQCELRSSELYASCPHTALSLLLLAHLSVVQSHLSFCHQQSLLQAIMS